MSDLFELVSVCRFDFKSFILLPSLHDFAADLRLPTSWFSFSLFILDIYDWLELTDILDF